MTHEAPLLCLPPIGPARAPPKALRQLRAPLDTGSCYVKLSAPYRLASSGPESVLIGGLVASYPERLLWGSDWAHTELRSNMPDDADLIDDLLGLLDEADVRRAILVDTPDTCSSRTRGSS